MFYRFMLAVFLLMICFVQPLSAEDKEIPAAPVESNLDTQEQPHYRTRSENAIKMLHSISKLKHGLRNRIQEKKAFLDQSLSASEKALIQAELKELDQQISESALDFKRIATGVDIGLFDDRQEEPFDWKNEVVGLVEPGIKELKRITVRARYKARLKDEMAHYGELVPVAEEAVENIEQLILVTKDDALKLQLEMLMSEWQGVQRQIQNKLDIVQMRLEEMASEEKSFIETSQVSIKNFFRTRGLFLAIAIVACIGVIFLLRFASRSLVRFIPGYTQAYRPFHVRMISLVYRALSIALIVFVLIFVFYVFEDWVLLSLTIIFIMGLGWAVKHALPQYWAQSRLMLNIGAVREGERMMLNGVPWLVKNINLFSEIENPSLGVTLRLPIEDLLGKTSRSFHPKEPWFPCRRNDWVILADGTRGVVTSLSHEIVELVQRGGARKTYLTGDFLSMSPLNLSMNFRLKVPFGIGYGHQKDATTSILQKVQAHVEDRIEAEGYHESLLNLRVEFQQAGASSLDMVVIADFKGDMAPLYQRLNRALQRWCVDACTANDWDIPFPQLTVHRAAQE